MHDGSGVFHLGRRRGIATGRLRGQGQLDEARLLVEQLEPMTRELMQPADGAIAAETLRQQYILIPERQLALILRTIKTMGLYQSDSEIMLQASHCDTRFFSLLRP